jgi:hypothetical protein
MVRIPDERDAEVGFSPYVAAGLQACGNQIRRAKALRLLRAAILSTADTTPDRLLQ